MYHGNINNELENAEGHDSRPLKRQSGQSLPYLIEVRTLPLMARSTLVNQQARGAVLLIHGR